jgi:cytidylate kinase
MINIAIDGPIGAGKSTVARQAAAKLGYIYTDTGALYRAIGLYCARNNITDYPSALPHVSLQMGMTEEGQRVFLNGEDVSEAIREPSISMMASKVSALPEIRAFLLDLQRDIARRQDVVMDGRDIGTVVLPNADVKIFLFASPEIRAKRRFDELRAKGKDVTFEEVLSDLNTRDYNDSHRALAPLKPADDAVMLDTSGLTFDEVVDAVVDTVKSKIAQE